MSKKRAAKKVRSLQKQIELHKKKIEKEPDAFPVPHWQREVSSYEEKIKKLLRPKKKKSK